MSVLQRSNRITLKKASEIIGKSYVHVRRTYHLWPNHGVRILKDAPNAQPRFYEEDIYRMLEKVK